MYERPMVGGQYPSVAVNCPGDMGMGFSGSSASRHIGAYYSWRSVTGGDSAIPKLIRAGITNYQDIGTVRLGDYSATTLDPADDWSFWTVQQYADPDGADFLELHPWKTVIAHVKPIP